MSSSVMRALALLAGVCGLLVTTGCRQTAPQPVGEQELLVGDWVGEVRQLREVEFTRWHVRRNEDGTFAIVFRNYLPDGSHYDRWTTGRWSAAGGIYRTTTSTERTSLEPGPIPVSYSDEYRILSLTRDAFSYQDLNSRIVFTVRRVTADYTFPAR